MKTYLHDFCKKYALKNTHLDLCYNDIMSLSIRLSKDILIGFQFTLYQSKYIIFEPLVYLSSKRVNTYLKTDIAFKKQSIPILKLLLLLSSKYNLFEDITQYDKEVISVI